MRMARIAADARRRSIGLGIALQGDYGLAWAGLIGGRARRALNRGMAHVADRGSGAMRGVMLSTAMRRKDPPPFARPTSVGAPPIVDMKWT